MMPEDSSSNWVLTVKRANYCVTFCRIGASDSVWL